MVTCPDDIQECTTTTSAAVVWPQQPTAMDNVDGSITNITCTDHGGNVVTSGGSYALGPTTVTCTARDSSGRQGMCTFEVTVTGMSAWYSLLFALGCCGINDGIEEKAYCITGILSALFTGTVCMSEKRG